MNIVKNVIKALRPDMKDLMTKGPEYWDRYENVLDACSMNDSPQALISLVNEIMRCEYSNSGAYDAATDIAITLENLASETYSKKFKY